MGRYLLFLLAVVGAASANAAVFLEYSDGRFLRDYETVRYRIDLEYGEAAEIRINIIARGLDNAPRVRVLDSRRRILTNRRDNGADHVLDFHYTARASRDDTFFIDVTHKYAPRSGHIDVTLQLDAETDADGVISFDRYYFDYHRPEDRHDGCSASAAGTSALPLLLAAGVLWARRRRRSA